MKAKLVLNGQYLNNPSREDKEVIKHYERVVEQINSGNCTGFCTPSFTSDIVKPLEIVISDFDDSGLSSRKENLEKIALEKQQVIQNIFPLFYEESKMIQEFQSKRVKHFMYLKTHKLKWKLLKGFMNLLLIFKSKKEIGRVNDFTKI